MADLTLATLAAQVFTGLVLGMILVLLAIGLSLIFGLMTVVNFAHGSLYMLGAYFGFFLVASTKSFWLALVVAPMLVGVFGLLVERFLVRRLYGRSIDDPLLLTFGLSLVLVEAVRLVWGKIGLTLDPPPALAGVVNLGFTYFPLYRLFVIGVTVVVLVALLLFLEKTNVGLIIRAGSRDPVMVRALGFDLGRVWLLVFGIGTALAGLAGILAGPMRGVYAEMGVTIVIESFVVVVVGGMGSLPGAIVAGLVIGQVVSLTTLFGVHRDGARPARPAERTLRRSRTDGMRALTGWIGGHPVLAFLVVFAVFPFLVPYKALATQVLIYGLFALGFNLLYGYTGLLSFGHAAYWGLGAYGTGIALAKLQVGSLWLALLAGPALAVVGGVVIGFLCLRRRGIYFAMLTLAFAQLLYFVGFHLADVTGGDDGLRGISVPPLVLPGVRIPLDTSLAFYYFAFALVALAVAGLKRILDSPFGAVLQAIRENSDRAVACGYDATRVKHLSFVFSALFAGLAGALDALRLNVVPIESLYWSTSGQVVIMTLLGGAGTFFGPFVGAATWLVLEDRLAVFTESWPLVVGAIFMAFVLFLPKGIWGTLLARLEGAAR